VPRLLSFIQAEEHLARRNVEAPQFSTFFTALDRAYDAAREAMVPEETDLLILQWFLFCHRSLLGAASMIAHGAPDDTAAITRRALEAALAAFAVCYDATNAAAWMAFEKRFARWKARETDDKPAGFSPKFTLPKDHARLNELGKWLGMLSDSGAHFTPEVMENFDFQRQGEKAVLGFFVTDREVLDRAIRTCCACHVIILQLFNEALKDAFLRSREWCDAMNAIEQAGARFAPVATK